MTKAVSQLKVKTAMLALIVREENLAEIEESIKVMSSSLPEGELVELANVNSVSNIFKFIKAFIREILIKYEI